jgi:hypothetical protein
MTIRLPEHDELALMPSDYVAHLYGRNPRAVREWVYAYSLTRFNVDGSRAKVGAKRYWLSMREIVDRVPVGVRERKGKGRPKLMMNV